MSVVFSRRARRRPVPETRGDQGAAHPVLLIPAHFRGRFRASGEILAHLEHPAIARLIDGGETDTGEPYLVMEYVEGEPIDAYCDGRRCRWTSRIALFLKVSEAVAYAHQNLVVHRDIKPSNVLVSAAGEVKLLDFGIAKVLSDGAESSSHTGTGERVMTPPTPRPSKCAAIPSAPSATSTAWVCCSTTADGRLPHRTGGCRTSWPPPSSTRSRCGRARPSSAEAALNGRAPDPQRCAAACAAISTPSSSRRLRKQPRRRYATVEALLEDLHRHLGRGSASRRAGRRFVPRGPVRAAELARAGRRGGAAGGGRGLGRLP
jgi:serine/threonine-protein kinase